jgi:hypothetical protein
VKQEKKKNIIWIIGSAIADVLHLSW